MIKERNRLEEFIELKVIYEEYMNYHCTYVIYSLPIKNREIFPFPIKINDNEQILANLIF